MSRPALGFTEPHNHRGQKDLSSVVAKRPERETDNSFPSRVEVKNTWSFAFTSLTYSWRGA
jgi:hypothetical protein